LDKGEYLLNADALELPLADTLGLMLVLYRDGGLYELDKLLLTLDAEGSEADAKLTGDREAIALIFVEGRTCLDTAEGVANLNDDNDEVELIELADGVANPAPIDIDGSVGAALLTRSGMLPCAVGIEVTPYAFAYDCNPDSTDDAFAKLPDCEYPASMFFMIRNTSGTSFAR
jgi:hypothetical protein